MGCQNVGVAAIPCALAFWGVCWPVGHPFVVTKGSGWHMSAKHVFRGTCRAVTRDLSKHGDPAFPHFCPLNQNVTRVRMGGDLDQIFRSL